jgi:hypothetical protein
MQIRLREYMEGPDAWGQIQGRQVHEQLLAHIQSCPAVDLIVISLDGVEHTDVSFPRESVVKLAKLYRGQRGVCLKYLSDPDLLENWDAAALRGEQPLFVWSEDKTHRIIGPQPSIGLRDMLMYVLSVPVAFTSEAASTLNLKVSNASNKLKQLWLDGYILRREQTASSGGIEYAYVRIAE